MKLIELFQEDVSHNTLTKKVYNLIAGISGIFATEIKPTDKLTKFGFDDMDLADVLSALEEIYKVDLMSDDVPEIKNVSQLIAYVQTKVQIH